MKTFFATTAKGMEPILVEELRALGAKDIKEVVAGASFSGTIETAYRACLWLRTANRVLLPLKSFMAYDQARLYAGVKSIKWSDHLEPSNTIAVDFTSTDSTIAHTHFGALKTKDAIVDQMREVHGTRPDVDPVKPDLRINVYVRKDEATVSLDLSGNSLHERGYRDKGVAAPLKENLAAALLILAGWPQIARAGGSLIDPMCGSGTIPIEAALMASNTAPGLDRSYYGFLKWKKHDVELWKKLITEAQEAELPEDAKFPRIVGYDHNFRNVKTAIENVEKAGVHGRVHIEKREFEVLEPIESFAKEGPRGIVVINPPYGERIGDVDELKPLYKQMGDIFKQKFKGWEGYILTGSPDLMKSVGLKAARRFVLFNGPIECRYLKYELYEASRKG